MTRPYSGTELDLFANAVRWKRYALGLLRPYARGHVLEVGAGIGANVPYLINERVTRWICMEPDAELAARISEGSARDPRIEVVCGTVHNLADASYDTLLYLDVLEHIEDDRRELACAADLLRPGGVLVVLAPAHQSLYSPFDVAIGHWRRYTRRTLLDATPRSVVLQRSFYLDSVGLLASAANRLLLKQGTPTHRQVQMWDRVMVPASRILDPLLSRKVGKSVAAIWTKPATAGFEGS